MDQNENENPVSEKTSKIKLQLDKLKNKPHINKISLIGFFCILVILPIFVFTAKTKTNDSIHAQDNTVLSTESSAEDEYIIPAKSLEDDQETYITPSDIASEQVKANLSIAEDSQLIASKPVAISTAKKPNIIFLLLDDAAYIDDRVWNRLPTIKKIFIDKGVRFTNFQGETPLCCPGRAGYLTGQHTFNHKVIGNDASLFNPRESIATELHEVGYYTFLSGKYFNGFNAKENKIMGWDNFSGFGGAYINYYLWNNGKHVYYSNQYSTDVIANKAVRYLREAPSNKSIFGYISPFAVHEGGGKNFPHPYIDLKYRGDSRCEGIPRWKPANYNEADMSDKPNYNKNHTLMSDSDGWDLTKECEALLSVEDLVIKVKNELVNEQRFNNTVFVMGVDNGMNWGAHRYYGKVWPYATQVSFFVHWPNGVGVTPFTIPETVTNIDVAPTFCEIAGCKMGPYPNGQQKADGISFLPLLKRQVSSLGRDAVLEDFIEAGAGAGGMPIYHALMTTPENPIGRWHYIEYKNGEKELYDISNGPCISWIEGNTGDPCELNNLLASNITPSSYVLQIASILSERLKILKVEKGYKSVSFPSPIPTPTITPSLTILPSPSPSPVLTP